MKPFVIASWTFLTIGIAFGSVWAYYELGWGGWWFWDPVENASFMPWLLGTALLHSLIIVEKRSEVGNQKTEEGNRTVTNYRCLWGRGKVRG